MSRYEFRPFDPCPIPRHGVHELEQDNQTGRGIVALDIQSKYQFVDEAGGVVHEYNLPTFSDIVTCGGYVDKIFKYRDPEIIEHFSRVGVNLEALADPRFPLLATRSPRLDIYLTWLIRHVSEREKRRVSLFDLGCSAGEHFDLIDVMLAGGYGQRAADLISYCGLDRSALTLSAARMLHANIPADQFRLIHSEGSAFDFPPRSFDLGLTVGVVNHVTDPALALAKLLSVVRSYAVLALWVTKRPKGFWAIGHSGESIYFFSYEDLRAVARQQPHARFHVADFIPDTESTQYRSYVGIGSEGIESLGCYHLVFTRDEDLPFELEELVL
jgi:SAM-dependent methyltransferase